jgi:hypothetical protein
MDIIAWKVSHPLAQEGAIFLTKFEKGTLNNVSSGTFQSFVNLHAGGSALVVQAFQTTINYP